MQISKNKVIKERRNLLLRQRHKILEKIGDRFNTLEEILERVILIGRMAGIGLEAKSKEDRLHT